MYGYYFDRAEWNVLPGVVVTGWNRTFCGAVEATFDRMVASEAAPECFLLRRLACVGWVSSRSGLSLTGRLVLSTLWRLFSVTVPEKPYKYFFPPTLSDLCLERAQKAVLLFCCPSLISSVLPISFSYECRPSRS